MSGALAKPIIFERAETKLMGYASEAGQEFATLTKFVGCSAAWGTAPSLVSRTGGAVPNGTAPYRDLFG
jgi:hypothetical protein